MVPRSFRIIFEQVLIFEPVHAKIEDICLFVYLCNDTSINGREGGERVLGLGYLIRLCHLEPKWIRMTKIDIDHNMIIDHMMH